jgi:AcrR family transcriptional regulator
MNVRAKQRDTTRTAILEALAQVVAESGATGFSVQDVADRAGLTHRTVYNHFPTREALNDAFAAYVEDLLSAGARVQPQGEPSLADVRRVPETLFPMLDEHEAHARAYVMLMIASRGTPGVHRKNTRRIAQVIEREAGPLPEGTLALVTAAVRMFASTWTWHLMTAHLGLSKPDALRAARWATEVLLSAVQNGNTPGTGGKVK